MKSTYDVLGNHIRLVDKRNRDMITDRVVGINIDKYFMPSVANVIGTDLSKYKLISKGLFACNPMHVGRDERLPVALYTDDEPSLVSPAYFMFEIKDNSILDDEFLMMWFRRKEFDRICWLKTDGSVRGGISWEDICRIEFPLLPISEQKQIVRNYNAISDRIELKRQLNDNLEMQIQVLFNTLFMSNDDYNSQLCDFSEINPIRQLCKNELAKCFDMATLPQKGCIPFGAEVKPYNGGMKFKNGDTILARITPCLENGKAAYINILDENEIAFGSTEFIVLAPKCNFPSSFFYFLVRNERFITFAISHMNGSSGRQRVSGNDISKFPLHKPDNKDLEYFDKAASKVLFQMKLSSDEINKLNILKDTLLSTISSR